MCIYIYGLCISTFRLNNEKHLFEKVTHLLMPQGSNLPCLPANVCNFFCNLIHEPFHFSLRIQILNSLKTKKYTKVLINSSVLHLYLEPCPIKTANKTELSNYTVLCSMQLPALIHHKDSYTVQSSMRTCSILNIQGKHVAYLSTISVAAPPP